MPLILHIKYMVKDMLGILLGGSHHTETKVHFREGLLLQNRF